MCHESHIQRHALRLEHRQQRFEHRQERRMARCDRRQMRRETRRPGLIRTLIGLIVEKQQEKKQVQYRQEQGQMGYANEREYVPRGEMVTGEVANSGGEGEVRRSVERESEKDGLRREERGLPSYTEAVGGK